MSEQMHWDAASSMFRSLHPDVCVLPFALVIVSAFEVQEQMMGVRLSPPPAIRILRFRAQSERANEHISKTFT